MKKRASRTESLSSVFDEVCQLKTPPATLLDHDSLRCQITKQEIYTPFNSNFSEIGLGETDVSRRLEVEL